jgi:hypothetical protein
MSDVPEPTNSEIIAAVQALTAAVEHGFSQTDARFQRVEASLAQLGAQIGQLRADAAAIKVDTGYTERYISDLQEAVRRHLEDPNAHGHAA